ncbi:protein FAM110C [Neosynchiropus ocellatus]
MDSSSDTSKILEKGPEYLRKQMELESETKGGMSAVERLAATKPKYVKSQEVVNSSQDSVNTVSSSSVKSSGSSNRSSGKLTPQRKSPEVSPQSCTPSQVRRSSSKKRPDSLLIYRQKCELTRGSANRRRHFRRKLLHNKPKTKASLPEKEDKECGSDGDEESPSAPEGSVLECSLVDISPQPEENGGQQNSKNSDSGKTSSLLTVPEHQIRPGRGIGRSHSDISSRYSKNFADFDAFFKYCGLDGEVIESLGRENFSARSDEIVINLRSVSVSTSDDGFSRNSGDSDGLLEDVLQKKKGQGTSVIERNARVIKWLYSCKNAKETGKKLRDLD